MAQGPGWDWQAVAEAEWARAYALWLAAGELLGKLIAQSGAILRLTKRAVRVGSAGSFADGLAAVEELYLGPMMDTEDAHEGLAAFMEKRAPAWKDR